MGKGLRWGLSHSCTFSLSFRENLESKEHLALQATEVPPAPWAPLG